MIRYFCLFSFLISLFIFSCSSDKLPAVTQLELCDTETFTYDIQVKEIINRTCSYSGCHDSGGSAPGNFNSYETMDNFLTENKFEKRVVDQQNMPDPNDVLPEKLLTSEELEILTCWVQQGYLEN